jgi:hypothetical protein
MGRRRATSVPEERLVAKVCDWGSSYYIGQHTYEAPIDDEAITTLRCEIIETESRHRQHIGQPIEIALVCSRRYSSEHKEGGHPSLFYTNLRKNQRSLLSYLPADAYWSLPDLLKRSADPCAELSFQRLHRGTGVLRSLWIGDYEQLLQDRADIAERTRAK